MRKGQMEMVGLVFVVILVVIGIVMYLLFSLPTDGGASQAQLQGITSFLISLKETTLPGCSASFERVVAACVQGERLCGSGRPCREAQRAMEAASAFLQDSGYAFNLSLFGTGLMVVDGCASAEPGVPLLAAPRLPIVYEGGLREYLVLAICR